MGSDVDIVIIVTRADRPFEMRAGDWETRDLPVPADLLVYPRKEWDRLLDSPLPLRFVKESVWL